MKAENVPWLIRADAIETPSSVMEFLTAEDFAEHWKDAPGMNYEGINMDKHPKLINVNKTVQNDTKFRKCPHCGKLMRGNDKKCCEKCTINKEIEKLPQAGTNNANTYYNPDANTEMKGQSSYPADLNNLMTPNPKDGGGWAGGGQDNAYFKMAASWKRSGHELDVLQVSAETVKMMEEWLKEHIHKIIRDKGVLTPETKKHLQISADFIKEWKRLHQKQPIQEALDVK